MANKEKNNYLKLTKIPNDNELIEMSEVPIVEKTLTKNKIHLISTPFIPEKKKGDLRTFGKDQEVLVLEENSSKFIYVKSYKRLPVFIKEERDFSDGIFHTGGSKLEDFIYDELGDDFTRVTSEYIIRDRYTKHKPSYGRLQGNGLFAEVLYPMCPPSISNSEPDIIAEDYPIKNDYEFIHIVLGVLRALSDIITKTMKKLIQSVHANTNFQTFGIRRPDKLLQGLIPYLRESISKLTEININLYEIDKNLVLVSLREFKSSEKLHINNMGMIQIAHPIWLFSMIMRFIVENNIMVGDNAKDIIYHMSKVNTAITFFYRSFKTLQVPIGQLWKSKRLLPFQDFTINYQEAIFFLKALFIVLNNLELKTLDMNIQIAKLTQKYLWNEDLSDSSNMPFLMNGIDSFKELSQIIYYSEIFYNGEISGILLNRRCYIWTTTELDINTTNKCLCNPDCGRYCEKIHPHRTPFTHYCFTCKKTIYPEYPMESRDTSEIEDGSIDVKTPTLIRDSQKGSIYLVDVNGSIRHILESVKAVMDPTKNLYQFASMNSNTFIQNPYGRHLIFNDLRLTWISDNVPNVYRLYSRGPNSKAMISPQFLGIYSMDKNGFPFLNFVTGKFWELVRNRSIFIRHHLPVL